MFCINAFARPKTEICFGLLSCAVWLLLAARVKTREGNCAMAQKKDLSQRDGSKEFRDWNYAKGRNKFL